MVDAPKGDYEGRCPLGRSHDRNPLAGPTNTNEWAAYRGESDRVNALLSHKPTVVPQDFHFAARQDATREHTVGLRVPAQLWHALK